MLSILANRARAVSEGGGALPLVPCHDSTLGGRGWEATPILPLPPTPIQLNSTAGIKQEFKIPPNCPTHLPLTRCLTKS